MSINWNFNANEVEEISFELPPIGEYRARIESVEEVKSKTNKDMLKMKIKLSGQSGVIFHNLVLDPSNTKMTNTNLSNVWKSFGIVVGNMNTQSWVGTVGAVKIKHEPYNGENRAKIHYFIPQEKQSTLPPWKESSAVSSVTGGGSVPTQGSNAPFEISSDIKDDEIQF